MAQKDFDTTAARLMSLASVGTEMVVPIGAGIAIDLWKDWTPWCSIIGAVVGLTLGVYHLILLNRPKSP